MRCEETSSLWTATRRMNAQLYHLYIISIFRLSKKVPFFLLGISALLSLNILLLLQQQPSSDGLPIVKTEFLDSRKLRQYVDPVEDGTFPAHIPRHRDIPDALTRPRYTGHQKVVTRPRPVQPIKVNPEPTAKAVVQELKIQPTTDSPPSKDIIPQSEQSVGKDLKISQDMLAAVNPAANSQLPLVIYGKSPKSLLPPLTTGAYITPNEILQRTAVAIKTFNRAECLLITVASFKQSYPDIPIFVADDSFEDTVSKNLTETYDVTYIRLPVDSGVGYGRNRLVEHILKMGES